MKLSTQRWVELEKSAAGQAAEVKGPEDKGPTMGLGSRARVLGVSAPSAEDACVWEEAASPVLCRPGSQRWTVGRVREPLSAASQVWLPQGNGRVVPSTAGKAPYFHLSPIIFIH